MKSITVDGIEYVQKNELVKEGEQYCIERE